MKLFQIEEPDGSPVVGDGPGVAVGIELSATKGAAVAVAVGGNAELLPAPDGARRIAMTGREDEAALAALMLRLREWAEKALARPVTHATLTADLAVAAGMPMAAAAEAASLTVLALLDSSGTAREAPAGADAADRSVLGAAVLAEQLGPRAD